MTPDSRHSTIQPILGELRRMYEGNAWHGPALLDVLRGVSATQAAARPVPGAHSIHELTHHVAAWIGEVNARLLGGTPGDPADGDFPPQGTIIDDAAWKATLERLAARQAAILETVAAFDPSRLQAAVNPTKPEDPAHPRTFYALVHGLVQHNAYHAGQIMLLRRALERAG